MAQSRSQGALLSVNGEQIFTWELSLLFPQVQGEMVIQGLDTSGDAVIKAANAFFE